MTTISNREEFVFLYDVTDNNPNGNPMDENKPRIDEESGINLVTDVRVKRTVRDYLYEYEGHNGQNGKDIFVRATEADKGGLNDGKSRAKHFKNDADKILSECIDIRLFGGVIPLDKDSIKYTGPVQLRMGRSLHPVTMTHIKGTGAFASKPGQKQQTFREEYILPYSLIAFYGIVNETAARYTGLSDDDLEAFYRALWNGAQNLISRSKVGHMPRLLVRVKYSSPHFFIGDLDKRIALVTDKRGDAIRDIGEVAIDLSKLRAALDANETHIASADLRKDDRAEIIGWES